MTGLVDHAVVPWLAFLAEWSLRWGLVLAPLAAWLALRSPRRAATRHLLCAAALAAGVLLPVVPRWGRVSVPWPTRSAAAAAEAPKAVVAPPSVPTTVRPPTPAPVAFAPGVRPEPPVQKADAAFAEPPAARATVDPAPQAPPLGPWRLAALVAAAAWGTVVLALVVRLAGGSILLMRLRRGGVAVGGASERLLDDGRRALGLSRPVALRSHPAVGSPVALGGRRPLVLVPPDWDAWPESHRRACLVHELTHLSRRDDWAKLAQEFVRVPFFFHPLVRWLLARLDRERELLCDEAVVALGVDPVAYARLLLDLARRPGRLAPGAAFDRPGWLPFLGRGTVAARIERLLEDDMPGTLSRPSVRRSVLLGTAALAAALTAGGLGLKAVEPPKTPLEPSKPTAAKAEVVNAEPAKAEPKASATRAVKGQILDPDGKPVAGATVVAGFPQSWKTGHEVFTTDNDGRFTWPLPAGPVMAYLVAHKEGLAPSEWMSWLPANTADDDVTLKLHRPEPFSAVLTDEKGRPIGKARVRVEMWATSRKTSDGPSGSSFSTGFSYAPREIISGSPLEGVFETTTDGDGAFTIRSAPANAWLKFSVTGGDGREWRVKSAKAVPGTDKILADMAFVPAQRGVSIRLTAIPAARIVGRVVTKMPNVSVAGLPITHQASRSPGTLRADANSGDHWSLTDDQGRFVIDGLHEGMVNVFVENAGNGDGGDADDNLWTYRAPKDVPLKPGMTTEVAIELIPGVKIQGTVVARGTGAPIEGAMMGVYGPYRPRSGAATSGAKTDARGRYHYRLPSGETYFYVMGTPAGYARGDEKDFSQTVTIPEGVTTYEVPPVELSPAVTVRGRVLDAIGAPVSGAKVVGNCERGVCRPFPGAETVTDARGEFRLPPALNNTVAVGKPARLLIRLKGGDEHEATAVPSGNGFVVVKLPAVNEAPKAVAGPTDVGPDELAGVVVDTDGQPIEGAEVDAWTWVPGHEAKTDAKGFFRIGKLDKNSKVEVVVRKPGYTPQLFLTQPTGKPGWVVVLGNKTYFEGTVTAPDGKPVANALIRANNGPKRADGVMITEIWTETTTDAQGRYRLYAQDDVYDIQVRVPGVGAARLPQTSLGADEAKRLDIALKPGVVFRAKVVDADSGKPVAGVRLWHWQHKGVEGRSDKDGVVTVSDMLPGPFNFQVDAPGYARWWSDQAANEWSRRKLDESRGGWQRNFDHIDFDLTPGMDPVTIAVERGVTVTGKVLDPDGKPVAGATVAPALTGTGNSLTGDTRFSVPTDAEGTFTVLLPASGKREYNLVAHDGKYQEWRNWANGVLPPFRTTPGQEIRDVELRLTRPATVRGRVTDAQGKPVAGREVRASAADRRENRYYDPTTKTAADGSYELKFVRPGEQFVQVAPFWLDAREAPEGTSQALTLAAGESKAGVDLRAADR